MSKAGFIVLVCVQHRIKASLDTFKFSHYMGCEYMLLNKILIPLKSTSIRMEFYMLPYFIKLEEFWIKCS